MICVYSVSDMTYQLVKFNQELNKKQKSLEDMWNVIAGMMHWMLNKEGEWVCKFLMFTNLTLTLPLLM